MGQPTPSVNSGQTAKLQSLRYNTSQAGQPLPLVYGTQRVSSNLIEYWGFTNTGGTTGKGGKGGLAGKSGGGGKKGSTPPKFSVFTAIALCHGPVGFFGAQYGSNGANRVWVNSGIVYGPGAAGFNFYPGYDGQQPDTAFASEDPNQPVLGYSGCAYLTGTPLQMGESPTIPNLSVEVSGNLVGTSPGYPDDARPDLVIADYLTNPRYGAGYPVSAFASLADFGNYCAAVGFAVSKLCSSCEPAARLVEELCSLTVAAPFVSAGLLKIVPYLTFPWTGNGTTWSPNTSIQYALTDDDFNRSGGADPVQVVRSDRTQATNWISMEYLNSANNYNNDIAIAFDQGAIDMYGLRNAPAGEGHCVTNGTTAYWSCWMQLFRRQNLANTFTFTLGWRYALLDPMDLVTLDDPGAGLETTVVRITATEEKDDLTLVFTAEDAPFVPVSAPVFPPLG